MWPTRGLGSPFLWATAGLGRKVTADLTSDDSTITSDSAFLGRISGSRPTTGSPIAGRVLVLRPVPDTTVTDDTAVLARALPLTSTDDTITRVIGMAATRFALSVRDTTGMSESAGVRRNDDANVIRLLDPDLFAVMYPEIVLAET